MSENRRVSLIKNPAMADRESLRACLVSLVKDQKNSRENLIELACTLKKENNREGYIYLLQILERENIKENLFLHIQQTLGKEKGNLLFRDLKLPPDGSPPETVPAYTKELVNRLEKQTAGNREKLHRALQANAHGISSKAFEREKVYFKKAASLKEYLSGAHIRAVNNLQNHADSGELWFEQIINQDVVDYVKGNQEILGGVLRENKIYLTKIPYRPVQWLKETNPDKKRYLACHCPMAREALNGADPVPPLWCHCSAGFAKQKFNALLEKDMDVEVVDSVLNGDKVCRFAIIL